MSSSRGYAVVRGSMTSLPHFEGRVVVIGGGFAGLAAAKTLQEKSSARITILEASSAVGGRTKSTLLPDGQKVELGATWLHGIQGHPIYDLAVKYGLMAPQAKKGTDFWKGSKFIREGELHALTDDEAEKAGSIVSTFAETVDEATEMTPRPASLGCHLRQKFKQLNDLYPPNSGDRELLSDVWAWRELLQRAIDGSESSDDASVSGLAEYEDLPGAWPPVTAGHQAVAERIASELPDVRLQTVVTKVRWGPDGAHVICQDGSVLVADVVIVTVSLGVLKEQHHKMFEPPLSQEKQKSIDRMGMGIVDKFFLTFGVEDGHSTAERQHQLLWSHKDVASFLQGRSSKETPAIAACWRSSTTDVDTSGWGRGVYSLRRGGSEFIAANVQLQNGQVADQLPNTDGRELEINRGEPQKRSVVAWISGQEAVMMEKASEEAFVQEVHTLMDRFPALRLPRSFKVTRSFWGTDPHTRGSYSYVAKAATCEDVKVLGKPVYVERGTGRFPVVCFAGEATSQKHIGTTAGAYFSGIREADRILESFAALEVSE